MFCCNTFKCLNCFLCFEILLGGQGIFKSFQYFSLEMMTHFNDFWVKIELCTVFLCSKYYLAGMMTLTVFQVIYIEMILFGMKGDFIKLFCRSPRCYVILSEGWSDRRLNLFLQSKMLYYSEWRVIWSTSELVLSVRARCMLPSRWTWADKEIFESAVNFFKFNWK